MASNWGSGRQMCATRDQQGTLSKERTRRLESIGIVWNPLERSFHRGYQATVQYKAMNVRANCPTDYVTPEGFCLGRRQSRIRFRCHRGIVPKERIDLLNQVGFDWGRSKVAMGDLTMKECGIRFSFSDAGKPGAYHSGVRSMASKNAAPLAETISIVESGPA